MNSWRESSLIWPVAVRNRMPASHSCVGEPDLLGERVQVPDQCGHHLAQPRVGGPGRVASTTSSVRSSSVIRLITASVGPCYTSRRYNEVRFWCCPTRTRPASSPGCSPAEPPSSSKLRDRLGRVSTFGEFAGPLLTFHGPRGLGKTSLLRSAQRDAEGAGFVTVWVSISRGTSLLDEIAAQVDRALDRTDTLSRTARTRWRTVSRKRGAELAAYLGPVKATVRSETTEEHESTPSAPIAAFEELLTTASQLVASPGGAGMVLFLDELHAAERPELAVLLNVLQNLDGDRENVPLAVFAAGLPSTPDAITKAATFGERTSFSQLLALPRADAAAALVDPARELEVSWSPDAVELVLDAAHGYPYFLQLLGSSVWGHARPEAGDPLTSDHVRSGSGEAVEQLAALYRVRWNAATDGEKDLMAVMADLSPAGDAVARRDVAEALARRRVPSACRATGCSRRASSRRRPTACCGSRCLASRRTSGLRPAHRTCSPPGVRPADGRRVTDYVAGRV